MKQQKEPRRGIISRCMNMGIVAVSLFALAGCQYEASVPDSFSETAAKSAKPIPARPPSNP